MILGQYRRVSIGLYQRQLEELHEEQEADQAKAEANKEAARALSTGKRLGLEEWRAKREKLRSDYQTVLILILLADEY